ncbi:MAG TPA: helix-turn-helix domain-containing protein [Solirubrobacterales bacterium]
MERSASTAARADAAERARADVAARLEDRRSEIETAVLTRVYAVSEPNETITSPEYEEGIRTAISAAVAYGLTAVVRGEEEHTPPPPILRAQARLAARYGIGLATVLRRYVAGHALLSDYLVEAAQHSRLGNAALRRLLCTQATLFDRLLTAVSEEHAREIQERLSSSEQRRAVRIERLLAGELVDVSGLAYDFDVHHLGLVASGSDITAPLRQLADSLSCRLLMTRRQGGTVWAWLGSRREVDFSHVTRMVEGAWPSHASLAIGEPGSGLSGWRLTHRQARAALPIALRGNEAFVRYAEVALLASMLQDDLLNISLRQIYLVPLERERDSGEVARRTLQAYFAAHRNVASAAAALGVSRQTVNSRLRTFENQLGWQLDDCATELEAALHLERLGHAS